MVCSFGAAPSTLIVLPVNQVMTSSQPAATIMDHVPMVNIAPFGMCLSVANPTVAAATSAALGVLTPMPCIPNTPAPWTPGSATVFERSLPVLNNTSKLQCVWGGMISIMMPGEMTEMVP